MRSRSGYSGSVFFIGLALLFITGWWWPGIIAVLALSAMVRAYERGKPIITTGHIFLLCLGVAFALGGQYFLPAILVALALSQLPFFRQQREEKRKRKLKHKPESASLDAAQMSRIDDIDEFLHLSPDNADGESTPLEELLRQEPARRHDEQH